MSKTCELGQQWICLRQKAYCFEFVVREPCFESWFSRICAGPTREAQDSATSFRTFCRAQESTFKALKPLLPFAFCEKHLSELHLVKSSSPVRQEQASSCRSRSGAKRPNQFTMIENFLNNLQGATLDCLQGYVGNDYPTRTLPCKLVLKTSASPTVSAKLSSSSVAAAMREKKFTWNVSVESDSRSSASGSHRPALKRYRPDDRSGKIWTSERERSEARLIGNELQEIAHRLFRFELATGTECSSKRLRESAAVFRINRSAQPRNHTESPHDDLDEEPGFVEPEPQSSSKSPQLTMKARFPSVSIPCPSMGSSPPPELFELRWEPPSFQQEMSSLAGTAQEDSDLFSSYCA